MKRLIIFLLLVCSVNALNYSYSTIGVQATVCDNAPGLNITSFIATPSPAYTDQLVIFGVTTKNIGNCYAMDNISLYINVYNSFGINVWNSSKPSDSNLNPGDAWTTEFYSTYFVADTYTVNITAVYTVQNFSGQHIYNSSTNSSLNLTVGARLPEPGPSPGGGGGGGGSLPPSIPKEVFVQFQKYPVLQEVAPGSLIIVDLTVKNPANKVQDISINFTGIPANWMTLLTQSVSIDPYALKTLSFTLNVPDNADSGDYLVKAEIQDKGIKGYSYFIVRVKNYPDNYLAPKMYRKVDLDFINNKSTVSIMVWNDANPHKQIDIYEKIPKVIADNVDQVDFTTAPNAIVQADPLVMFTLDDVRPGEKRSIDYTVNNVIDQYEPYVYWPIEQVNILYEKGVDKVQISNLYQNVLVPGGSDNYITFDIGNIYTDKVNVTITPWLPDGWNATPASINLIIPPYSQTSVRMGIYAPEDIQEGNYYGGLYITYENTTITKELSFRSQAINALGGLFTGLRLVYDNGYLVLLAVSILIIMVIRVVRTRRRYEYKEDVSDTLSEIKGIVFRRR